MTNGAYEEAREAAKLIAEDIANDMAQAFYSLVLYVLRDLAEAKAAAADALFLNRHCWLAHFVMTMVSLAEGHGTEAFSQYQRMCTAMEDLSNRQFQIMPGLRLLCAANDVSLPIDKFVFHKDITRANFVLAEMPNDPDQVDYFQRALWQLGMRDFARRHGQLQDAEALAVDASDSLVGAAGQFHPMMLWIHLWPFLDSSRSLGKLRELLHSWKLPEPPSPKSQGQRPRA